MEIQNRIANLRKKMQENGINIYMIVSDDFHASEYVGDYFKCREYMSGFDGSAGTLVITEREAGLWTDGRYFIQAEAQLKGTGIDLYKMGQKNVPTILEYLKDRVKKEVAENRSVCLGYDGRTMNVAFVENMQKELAKISQNATAEQNITAEQNVTTEQNITYKQDIDLVGEVWPDRPDMSKEPIFLLEEKFSGRSTKDKLQSIRETMKKEQADYLLLASLDDIAWLYNIRGNDVEYNPVVLSYSLISGEKACLYINQKCVANENVQEYFKSNNITIRNYEDIYDDLKKLDNDSKIMLDKSAVNVSLLSAIDCDATIINKPNPTKLEKSIKNQTEMENERKAHLKDGVALTKLIYWLKNWEKQRKYGNTKAIISDAESYNAENCDRESASAKNNILELTELDVCEKLEELRKMGEGYIEQSFAPISAWAEHGAIVHYEPTEKTNATITDDNFLLLDTGGQYYEGTTDVTRTIAFGELTEKQKACYTAVLRGNLSLAAAYFKYGCTGVNLDYLARSPLWEMGLDYNHGTGHGVGYLLNVHEGPNGIRLKEAGGKIGTIIEEGMITSDEPGVYLEGEFGIRLENMILARKAKETEYGQFMEFETLTLVPFDRKAIVKELMTERELALLNAYHHRVYEEISLYLTAEEKEWLFEETREIH